MRPPGGVSFADGQMNRGAPTANVSNRQHENGRNQIVHQQKPKSGNAVANGFGKNRQKVKGKNGRGRDNCRRGIEQRGIAELRPQRIRLLPMALNLRNPTEEGTAKFTSKTNTTTSSSSIVAGAALTAFTLTWALLNLPRMSPQAKSKFR